LLRVKLNQPVFAVEADRFVRARQAHRPAVLAQNLRRSSTRNRVFAGGIVSSRPRHFTARSFKQNLEWKLWRSRRLRGFLFT
jgi:hypothetical protein